MTKKLSECNNMYDLIRVFAAIQVIIGHINLHILSLKIPSLFIKVLSMFPGVCIFFALAGYFVGISMEGKTDKQFIISRFFRIYPLMWVVQIINILMCICFVHPVILGSEFIKYLIFQLTIFNANTPSFMSNFGTGAINGALWTIPVEMIFYVIVILNRKYFTSCRVRQLFIFYIISLGIAIGINYLVVYDYLPKYLKSIILVMPFPYLYIFITGMIFFKLRKNVKLWVEHNKIIAYISIIIAIFIYIFLNIFFDVPNGILTVYYGIIRGITLPIIVLFSGMLCKFNIKIDLTYPSYLIHMTIISLLAWFNYLPSNGVLVSYLEIIFIIFMISYILQGTVGRSILRVSKKYL